MAIKNRKFVVLIFTSTLLITFSFYFYQVFFTANIQVEKKNTYLYISDSTSYEKLIHELIQKKIIEDIISFRFVSKLVGYPNKVRPGRYLLESNTSNLYTILKLRSGKQNPVKVTFTNVRLKKNLSGKICRNLELDSLAFDRFISNSEWVQKYGFDTTTVLCMFIPNTYEMYWNISSEKLFKRFYHEYQSFWNSQRREKANAMGLTPIQVIILASIVEVETGSKEERPRVAGVYINRLNKNMRLQADPTIVFAVGSFELKRVLAKHKKIDSPYNTYKYSGLPPGPIYIPSITSIDAVLNYEKHDYLYFCAKEDFSGNHRFAISFEEHLKNAQRYQKALNQAHIN